MLTTKQIGDLGELKVKKYLTDHKFVILAHNYKKKHGELDIVAQKKDLIIVVEVKTRKQNTLRRGVLSVNVKKRLRIIKTTQLFLIERGIELSGLQIRFDIAEIITSDTETNKIMKMNYFENAFDASDISDFLFI